MGMTPNRTVDGPSGPIYIYEPPQTDQFATLLGCPVCDEPIGTGRTLASILERDRQPEYPGWTIERCLVHVDCLVRLGINISREET